MNDLQYWLALSQVYKLPLGVLDKILNQMNMNEIFHLSSASLRALGVSEEAVGEIHSVNWSDVARAEKWLEAPDSHLVTYQMPTYPRLFREIPSAPRFIYVRGDVSILPSPQVAMVGSRKPTPSGMEIAQSFACSLAQAGLVITSGLAHGIDAASHEGAIRTGRTIGVLGTGLMHIYPKRNEGLARRILDSGGALVSEFPLNTPPKPWHFPLRNRIISGLSLATLVVEATERSGSLITARLANEQGRDVFSIPGSIDNRAAQGCLRLIKEGAALVSSVEDVLSEMNWNMVGLDQKIDKNDKSGDNSSKNLLNDSLCLKVLKAVDLQPTPVDKIVARTALPVNKVNSLLTELELGNYITAQPGGFCKKRTR